MARRVLSCAPEMGTTASGAVIVVTDLSRHGRRAVEDAHALASATSSPVVAVTHAELLPVRRDTSTAPEELDEVLRDHVAGVARGGAPIARLVLEGETTGAVSALAMGCAARIIIVAAPIGRRHVPRSRSLAEQLVQNAARPVLVTARTDVRLSSALLSATAELTEPSTSVARSARRADDSRTRVLACLLGDEREAPLLAERSSLGGPSRARDALLEHLRPFDLAVYPDDVHVFPLSPERAIASLADRHDADLVVLACQGHSSRFALSNVASRVVAKTRCPVLTLPVFERAAMSASSAEPCPAPA